MTAQKLWEKQTVGIHIRFERDVAVSDDLMSIGAGRDGFDQSQIMVADIDPDHGGLAETEDGTETLPPVGGRSEGLRGRERCG